MDISEALSSAIEHALPPAQPKPDDADNTQPLTPDDDTPDNADASSEEAAVVEAPDGYVVVPTVADDLATEFTLRDAEGEVEVPDLMVEYKANGKVRKDRLDQVVKLAQWGVYNQEREQKVQQVEHIAQQVQQERENLATLLSEREAQIERLLLDDDFLFAVRDAYNEENSPEKRATRAEQQVQDIRIEQQMAVIAEQGTKFSETEVEPALNMILEALPTISEKELSDKFQMAMYAHVERAPNGEAYIPPSRYDAVRQYILDDLAVWAQAQHSRRSSATTATPQRETQQALAERDKARSEAQKAKRVVGQKMMPVGSVGKPSGKPKAPVGHTIDDAVASALDSALSSFR